MTPIIHNITANGTTSLFQSCLESIVGGVGDSNDTTTSTFAMLSCVSDALEHEVRNQQLASSGISTQQQQSFADLERDIYLLYDAILVFFMQAGFAMICAGSVRRKNQQNTLLKNLLDACGATIAFFTIGYAFAYGDSKDPTNSGKTFMGTSNFFLMGVEDFAFWLFEYAFCATSATIVAGSLAERCQMGAYLLYSVMLTGWVYPIIAHSIWSTQGFLSPYSIEPLWNTGMLDFSGAGVVHVTGGMTALFATMILGPRRGRFHDEEGRELDLPKEFPPSSVALQMLGTFILWFSWFGFNSGNAWLYGFKESSTEEATLAAVNTALSGGVAGLIGIVFNFWWLDKTTGEAYFEIKYAMNGTLSGLVAITGGCALVEPWVAVIAGCLAGINYTMSSRLLVHYRIDDAVDAIPVHLFNGVLGVIVTGLFASPHRLLNAYGRNDHVGLFYSWSQGQSDFVLLGTQLIGLVFIVSWVIFFMVPFFIFLDFMGLFRSELLEEIVGLDTSYHGGIASSSLYDAEHDQISEEQFSELKKRRLEAKRRKLRIVESMDDETKPESYTASRNTANQEAESYDDKDNKEHFKSLSIFEAQLEEVNRQKG